VGVGRKISTRVCSAPGLLCQFRKVMVTAKPITAAATAPSTISKLGKLDRRRNGIAGDTAV
jgi:hypothetical protein